MLPSFDAGDANTSQMLLYGIKKAGFEGSESFHMLIRLPTLCELVTSENETWTEHCILLMLNAQNDSAIILSLFSLYGISARSKTHNFKHTHTLLTPSSPSFTLFYTLLAAARC